jgi:uncharacterized protein (DUF2267 family)
MGRWGVAVIGRSATGNRHRQPHPRRDWLQVNEAAHLGAQMPAFIRGLYYEGWRPAGTLVKPRSRGDFCARGDRAFEPDSLPDVEDALSAIGRSCEDVAEAHL